MCAVTVTQADRKRAKQPLSRMGNGAKDGCWDDGLRWNEVTDVLAEDI